MSKVTIEKKEEVREYVESRGGRIIKEYSGAKNKIELIGTCGHQFEIKYNDLKKRNKGTVLCQKCNSRDSQRPLSDSDWEERSKSIGFKDATIKKDRVFVICSCGHDMEMSLSNFRKRIQSKESRCRNCITNSKRDFTKLNVKKIISDGGGKMISITDDNKKVTLMYKCGHTGTVSSENVKHKIKKYGYLLCPDCANKEHKPDTRESSIAKEMIDYVKRLESNIVLNYRKDYPRGLEADIFIPDKNIGIEFNGTYWHSENAGKGKMYHINKAEYFHEQGIQILQFTDVEWATKKEIVMSMIRAKLSLPIGKFYGRECKIKKIEAKQAKVFFDTNHLQGGNGVTNESYGLFAGGVLISAMTFRKTAGLKENSIELYRFATLLNTTVIGGFKKLLKYASSQSKYSKFVTYADLRFSSLDPAKTIYGASGFVLKKISPPNYKYFKDPRELMDRRKFQKHKLEGLLEKYDKSLTEVENMKNNGFNRIFDCGNMVFELIL